MESGSTDGASAFANAARTASFAVVGAVDSAPSGSGGHGGEESEATESSLSGGPNVVEGVPEDADHVVDMQAVAFAPEELTVSVGDTVAWKHAGGEAHNVVAYEEELPDDATYWASGGFESERPNRLERREGRGPVWPVLRPHLRDGRRARVLLRAPRGRGHDGYHRRRGVESRSRFWHAEK